MSSPMDNLIVISSLKISSRKGIISLNKKLLSFLKVNSINLWLNSFKLILFFSKHNNFMSKFELDFF